MLSLIGRLSPVLAIVLGLMGGTGLTLGATKLWNDWVDNPSIIRTERAVCTAEVAAAAAKATRDEQLRQFRMGEAATNEFIKETQAAADDAVAQRDLQEMEIEQYEKRIATTDRQCGLDSDDLRLLGLHDDSAAGRN